MKKFRIAISFFLVLLLLLLLRSKWYYFNSRYSLSPSQQELLGSLAAQSLNHKDVPIGSFLIYKDSIIGIGYNTVKKDTSISGHAELNAISNAIKLVGWNRFNDLSRDSLVLVTTFEPCLMCKGALIERNIRKIAFVKEKSLTHWLKHDLSILRYEFYKTTTNITGLQDSLFKLHQNYPHE